VVVGRHVGVGVRTGEVGARYACGWCVLLLPGGRINAEGLMSGRGQWGGHMRGEQRDRTVAEAVTKG